MIPLKEELRNASDYVELENIRFDGNITLIIESDFTVQNVLVPKFSIQLLCENAIKHGMIDTKTPLQLRFSVSKMRRFHQSFHNGKAITKSTFGIGLTNLQERLQHLVEGQITITSYDPPNLSYHFKGTL